MTDSTEAAVRRLEIGIKTCNFLRKRVQHWCFTVNIKKNNRMPLVAASDSNIKVLTKKLKFDQHLFLKRK